MTERKIKIHDQACCLVNAFEGWTFHAVDCENYVAPEKRTRPIHVHDDGTADDDPNCPALRSSLVDWIMRRLEGGRRLDLSEAVYFMDEDVEAAIRAELRR